MGCSTRSSAPNGCSARTNPNPNPNPNANPNPDPDPNPNPDPNPSPKQVQREEPSRQQALDLIGKGGEIREAMAAAGVAEDEVTRT